MIRILIADDHAMIREALSSVLEQESDIAVVGQADNGESAVRLCRELLPDLVLMDIALPDMSGTEATRRLVGENASLRVLAVSTYLNWRIVEAMLEAGATGYINKGASGDELLQGIRAVMTGTSYLSQNVAALLSSNHDDPDRDGGGYRLGKREIEVLMLIAQGRTSAEIAVALNIAVGTADVHRYNIMRKLELHGIPELTKYAIRAGLVAP